MSMGAASSQWSADHITVTLVKDKICLSAPCGEYRSFSNEEIRKLIDKLKMAVRRQESYNFKLVEALPKTVVRV